MDKKGEEHNAPHGVHFESLVQEHKLSEIRLANRSCLLLYDQRKNIRRTESKKSYIREIFATRIDGKFIKQIKD